MNIVLFNPNTTESMTARMHAAAAPMVGRGTSLIPLTAAKGMPSIEGYYDEVFVVPPMIEALTPMAGEIDGVVVGCFDDTGVDALRAFLDVPEDVPQGLLGRQILAQVIKHVRCSLHLAWSLGSCARVV